MDEFFKQSQAPSLLVELHHLLSEFHSTLEQEAEAIQKNRSEQVLAVISRKQQQSEQLNQITEQINKQLSPLSLQLSDLFSLQHFERLPETLQESVLAILQLTEACHNLNQSNGMAIKLLSNINQHAIDLIFGKDKGVELYSPEGVTKSDTTRKSLGKA
ncbi:flagella synthesis protein FlgN [Thiomicrorhabdus heinhorstiae]|uniref:Flagellar protein FlgN n=2 Tax=Thiomicrorhabdus TaxID=2039723 RepID=A0ABS0BY27_9GAMM|nr:flagellar protein FlgN [Thiomicrorhabdus heinhorstiae]MBF6058690.1 flagellar protein FlgN [Thiomicrorhabdus heinhorstiae]